MDQSVAIDYPPHDLPAAGQVQSVAPGIDWVRMPLPFALDHVNLWLVADGDGYTLVDAGIALDSIKQCWEAILATACAGRPVKRLIVTHFHPDHLGLGAWFAEKLGIEVWMTQGEYLGALAVREQLAGYGVPAMLQQFRSHGLDEARLDALARRGNSYRRGVPELPGHYRRIIDGEELRIGAHTWRVMVGYGHSPEHAALYCAELGVLISGDMVLPRITTNISVIAATPDADPLQLFLDSLARYAQLPADTLVLPSHGRPFRGLRQRADFIAAHHRERCEALLACCQTPRTAAELLPTLFTRELDAHQVMFAMGETIAHLNRLVHGGELRKVDGGDGITQFVTLH